VVIGVLSIGVLGVLTLTRDGQPLRTPPPGQRAVLGLLAVNAGLPVSLDAITDMLWAEQPPASAPAIVQTYVSRLRTLLGGSGRLTRDGGAYRLHVADEELDLLAFRRLVAAERHEQALDLWRGEPLADIDVLRGHPALTALPAEHAAAVLAYFDAAASYDGVLPHLRALAAHSPLDEAVRSRLMIALASTGHQAEALETYEDLRRLLDEELGVHPGPALREAHVRVLRQEVSTPEIPEAGWLPLFQLPAAPGDFTGRAPERARLTAALTEPGGVPVAAVSGAPGVGKTALALQVAHALRAQFPDGQLWVHLAGTSARPRDPGEVLGEFLRALGAHGSSIPPSLSERAVCYRSRIADRRILIVADDAASAEQVRPLIPGTAGCALLVTSRSCLESLAGARLLPLDVLSASDAAGLLTAMVGADRVRASSEAVASLIQACGSLPLALRIAGAKLAARPSWPLVVLARRISGAQDRLAELESADLSVRASIASSYQSLPERSRRAFALLSLLGPADFAEWVVGALLGEPDAAGVVNSLTDQSMLTALGPDATGEPRYRLHDLLRDFAAEQLAAQSLDGDLPGPDDGLDRLLHAWLQLTMLANVRLPPEPYFPPPAPCGLPGVVPAEIAERLTADPIAWFTAERLNLLAAVEQAAQRGELDLACQLACRQGAFQHLQYRLDDAEYIWRAIESVGDESAAAYARLRVGASLVLRAQAPDAVPVLSKCMETADPEVLALALNWRATCAWDLDDFAGARDDAARGIMVARQAGSVLAEHRNQGILGVALARLGSADEAVAISERSLVVATSLGATPYEIEAIQHLAFTYTMTGRYDRAVDLIKRGIDLTHSMRDPYTEALFFGVLGDAYQGLGRYGEAAASLQKALAVFRQHGSLRYHALCLLKLGYAYQAMGSPQAVGHLAESLRMFEDLRLPLKARQAQEALDACAAPGTAVPGASSFESDVALCSRVIPSQEHAN
jgi:DNA-binding SARP family transcriptional activator/tetratricopeptide (TPR) repeat protein